MLFELRKCFACKIPIEMNSEILLERLRFCPKNRGPGIYVWCVVSDWFSGVYIDKNQKL